MDGDADRILRAGHTYPNLVGAWFDAERQGLLARADRLIARADCADEGQALVDEAVRVKHALQTIAQDRWFIRSMLSRALRARRAGPQAGKPPFHDGCDALAAAALAAIARSEAAWRVLAEWMDGSVTALLVAGTLAQLRAHVEQEFPSARPSVIPVENASL
jgi:hypothetical protein